MPAFGELSGKVGVVTGGASGIGKGIAQALIAQGMQVVIADVEPGALERTAAEIGAVPVRTDVSKWEEVQALAETVKQRFGTAHVVCNNAGVGAMAKISKMSVADWRWIVEVNLFGVIHGVTAFLPMLKANPDGGYIVNTASTSGLRATPGLGGYATTKYGVVALSESLAEELAQAGSGVGVTVLCPGPVHSNIKASSRNRPEALPVGGLLDVDLEQTDFGKRMRWMDPRDVGELVVRCMADGELYALTHPEMAPEIEDRNRRISEAFARAAKMFGQPGRAGS